MKHTRLAIVASCLFLGACAVGNKHEYGSISPDFALQTKRSVAVGVVDQRSYVLDRSKSDSFVGLSRGGFGNPFDVTTASDRPLADDFRSTLVGVFARNGMEVKEVALAPSRDEGAARQALLKLGQGRAVLVALREWKSDTYTNTALHYDVEMSVYDASGRRLASRRLEGNDDLGGDLMNPPGHAKRVVPMAYRRKLEELLATPEIRRALQ
jgi:hypothetical protein